MAITVKHTKVSTIPDTTDTSLVRPSDWNADHTLVGTIDVANGGTGASTLTGYVKGNGTSAMTAVATVPSTDITGLGTMSTQNANAVAITGGTINGTTIGATVPSSVNATTITGQTGQLNGTGQNLFLQSQTFNTTWATTNLTVTANTSTAPDGTTTAETIDEGTASGTHLISQSTNILANTKYTFSCYGKNVNGVYLVLSVRGANGNIAAAEFNISTGTLSKTYAIGTGFSVDSTSIIAVGNNWYRCSVSVTTGSTVSSQTNYIGMSDGSAFATSGSPSYTGTNRTVLIWGSQFEFGSTANTYIPTTTTAVYGTPTLSFSGVSTIGLESNGALFVSPAGTGALQAQATTSSTVGGNVRGANAVDWQTIRSAANQVASGSYAVVGGGANNRCSAFNGTVVGGSTNAAASNYSFIGGGASNTASSGDYGTIAGGQSNVAAGYYNFIGGGFTNAGTSGSAVTTQSGTMNATTAVTLSGSNANIKVGQYISSTSIAGDTYVAAISGTSLTLSKNASGSSTSTLSFFTPHGVVVGGGNNQATGAYSAILGGGDAGTAANRNVASGDWSVVVGGFKNTASGLGSFVGGGGWLSQGSAGNGNTASSTASTVLNGAQSSATGAFATVINGSYQSASGTFSTVATGSGGTTRSIQCSHVVSAVFASNVGDAQAGTLVIRSSTTDATATALTTNGTAASTTNQVILPNNSAYFFTGEVISGVTGGGNTKGFTIEGVIKRGANAASTALVGTPTVTSTYADAGASAWAIAVTADTTNGGLRVTFTGQAATTIRTVCQIRTTEMTY